MSWDVELFELLNSKLTHPALDALMPALTSSATYRVPLLLAALALIVWGTRRQRHVLLGLVVCVGLTDLVSSRLVKPIAGRLRPSFTQPEVRLLIGAKRSFSMPSSHAANLSAATWCLLRGRAPGALVAGMAAVLILISYSRIYVGVHYPSDVLAGALLGALLAEGAVRLLRLNQGARPCASEPSS
jgi:undecaprenyl-diphosphatase